MVSAKDTCYVLKKIVGEEGESNSTNQLFFDQVCLISISNDGYMSCSCGGIQRYLMPRHHICAILVKKHIMK